MKLFSRKPKELELHAIVDGPVIPLKQVTNIDDISGVNAPLTTSGHHGEVAQIINL
ncbi:hypothetical protein CRL705_1106 [Latilactobacillus curvatus CRL 705]|uniref:hypothetical protein n=1 Tax=Latilactobacillus curvatus TaxID=28038 RepID=UPI000230F01B|nr:hypothetical protein [Latilactobacillus curvatus]EHE85806.1 hypothetical protein CRL705_1106 [Latilactobacillus curvatus CRL 705]